MKIGVLVTFLLIIVFCLAEDIQIRVHRTMEKNEVIDVRTVGLFQNTRVYANFTSNLPIQMKLIPSRGTIEVDCSNGPSFPITISKTDLYVLILLACPERQQHQEVALESTIRINGPYGHLPGKYIGNLIAHPILLVCWFVLMIVWSFHIRMEFFNLSILATIILSFLSVLFMTWHTYTENFLNAKFFYLIQLLFTFLQKISARVMSILISMGYGTHVSRVGSQKYILAVYSVVYLGCLVLYEVFRDSYNMLASFPIAMVDSVFYVWIFFLIEATLQQLHEKKQFYKMQIILRMKYGFLIFLFFSFIVMTGQIVFQVYYYVNWWYLAFMFDFVWEMGFIAMLILVIFLFFPKADQKAWIEAEEIQQEEPFDDQDIEDVMNDNLDDPIDQDDAGKKEKIDKLIETKFDHKD
jgi:hypothetical protein